MTPVNRSAFLGSLSLRLKSLVYASIPMLVILGVWQVLAVTETVPPTILPRPKAVLDVLVQERDLFASHIAATAMAVITGFGLAALVGIPLGWMIVSSQVLSQMLYPVMVGSQAVPKVALGPVFVLWFGFGLLPKTLLAFLVAFFPITVGASVGFSTLGREWFLLTRSMRATRLQTVLKLQIPAALPATFGGLKVASALAVVGATVGEFVGSDQGLAYLLLIANANRDTAMVFASLIVLSGLGVLLYTFVAFLEFLFVPWKDHDSARLALGGTA